ncbi:LuxR C-terminal-related transcriptional regulator [Sphingomonas sp. R647]|uniref:response regulator transcription factor n=1 Tax=Sphingomonas sp. R647 TaxID=2875233 RepID=UPI001CD7955D|nr:LuxR C-terminal-related transcriptional regulator [Sphingomonas sp. R647]MCA1196408.1 LuxR C-terminal-related transcriptional regulator [Sphingomonas sp. R647]
MQVQRAERKSTGSRSGSSVAKTLQRSALVPGIPDQSAAYALLAEQCRARVEGLAPRQRDVLAGLAAGHSNKQIAHTLGLSPRTVEIYRAGMMSRLQVRTSAQAMQIAFVAGLVPFDTMTL